MVVNTGRTASRAFYLNLRAQPDPVVCSRTGFDFVTSCFISYHVKKPLRDLIRTYDASSRLAGEPPLWGIVFHGVRPRLAYPFDSERNRALLTAVRDELNVHTVFLPVRDPEAVFLSELNRRLATTLGDWVFPERSLGWQRRFRLQDLARLETTVGQPLGDATHRSEDIEPLARDMATRTGKSFSIYRLFKSVFPRVYLIPYERFLERPREVLQLLAQAAGFRFANNALADIRLNSLANRLLCYNPITLHMRDDALPGRFKERFAGLLRRGGSFPHGPYDVRFRFEIAEVIELCDDWGTYVPLDVDCTEALPRVAEDLSAHIGLGVNIRDLAALAPSERALVQNPRFLSDLVSAIAPVFEANYEHTKAHYRGLYFNELPPEARKILWEVNGRECEQIRELLGVRDNVL